MKVCQFWDVSKVNHRIFVIIGNVSLSTFLEKSKNKAKYDKKKLEFFRTDIFFSLSDDFSAQGVKVTLFDVSLFEPHVCFALSCA